MNSLAICRESTLGSSWSHDQGGCEVECAHTYVFLRKVNVTSEECLSTVSYRISRTLLPPTLRPDSGQIERVSVKEFGKLHRLEQTRLSKGSLYHFCIKTNGLKYFYMPIALLIPAIGLRISNPNVKLAHPTA